MWKKFGDILLLTVYFFIGSAVGASFFVGIIFNLFLMIFTGKHLTFTSVITFGFWIGLAVGAFAFIMFTFASRKSD